MLKRVAFLFYTFLFSACIHDKYEPEGDVSEYPPAVAQIIRTKCATPGCHNTQSKDAAAGLDLSTWKRMFDGSVSGAVTIPFSSDFSTLLYYSNTDSTDGIVAFPTMPYNQQPLTKSEYHLLRDWINSGAPDENNTIMYADNPDRKKIYIVNQGCDNVAVIDAASKNIMRYVDVGVIPGAVPSEAPHMIRVAPDGKTWVALFTASNVMMQIFDATDDHLKFNVYATDTAGWNTFIISEDSKKAYACNFSNGTLAAVNLETGTVQYSFHLASFIHGVALNETNDTLYVCQNIGGALFKLPVNSPGNYTYVPLYTPGPGPDLMPHQILFTADYSHYIVTCEGTGVNKVHIYKTADDRLAHVINVGIKPEEMAISYSTNRLFVTCKEDNYFSGTTGSVSVIDLNTFTEIQRVKVGWRPHGIAVDEEEGLVYVANSNYLGLLSHHPAACQGQNGSLSVINVNTLQVIPAYSTELSVDPYSVTIRK